MPFIFHQNMEDYGGGTAMAKPPHQHLTRNQRFVIDFTAIQAQVGQNFLVAGFTELLNNNAAATGIVALAAALDPNLTRCVVIGVGITVTGMRDEHIAIAWNPNLLTVRNAGQVIFNAMLRRWECHNTARTATNPLPATLPMPDVTIGRKRAPGGTEAADSRGVAYISGTYNNAERVFAFMHNMYEMGDRSSSFSSLDAMMVELHSTIRPASNLPDYRDYIGGDFNVPPRNPTTKRGGELEWVAAMNPDGYPIDTTRSNPYDFWLTNSGAYQTGPAPRPRIMSKHADYYYQTLDSNASDHCAVSLRFPADD